MTKNNVSCLSTENVVLSIYAVALVTAAVIALIGSVPGMLVGVALIPLLKEKRAWQAAYLVACVTFALPGLLCASMAIGMIALMMSSLLPLLDTETRESETRISPVPA